MLFLEFNLSWTIIWPTTRQSSGSF